MHKGMSVVGRTVVSMDVALVVIVAIGALVAALVGAPVTKGVFTLIDRRQEGVAPLSRWVGLEGAAAILRGGVWIGVLERLAIYAGLVARWPDAIAVVLAVKGLGRYPELRAGDKTAVAERFIIGTFVSVLWACGCAGIVMWLTK